MTKPVKMTNNDIYDGNNTRQKRHPFKVDADQGNSPMVC